MSSAWPAATGRLASGSLAIAAAMLGIMAAVVIYTVFQRYLLGQTPYWSEELPRLLLIWMAFLGAVAAAVHGGHLSAGLLPLLVRSERCATAFSRFLRLALTALFSIVMIKASFDLARLTSGQLTAALQISASWAYAACAVGFAGLAHVSRLGDAHEQCQRMSAGLAVLFGVFIAAVLIDAPIAIALGARLDRLYPRLPTPRR